MTLSKLFVRTEDSFPYLFRVYKSLKGYRASKKYKIPYFFLDRFFDLNTSKIAQEIEKKICKFFNKTIPASICQKKLAALLKAPEKIVLQPEGVRVW